MDNASIIEAIVDPYNSGHRYFLNIDFENGEKLSSQQLSGVTFDNCSFSVNFSGSDLSNTRFWNCNLKCSDFSNCNLTNTSFESCALENTNFKDTTIKNTAFLNCYCYSQKAELNEETREIEPYKTPLIRELYERVPEFEKFSDHTEDDLDYLVYGNLSNILSADILKNDEITPLTKQSFSFFNQLGNRNDEEIDNLLVVGVYEALYSDKKCNDIARQLLTGRNKEVYEYWMKNGNIRAEY